MNWLRAALRGVRRHRPDRAAPQQPWLDGVMVVRGSVTEDSRGYDPLLVCVPSLDGVMAALGDAVRQARMGRRLSARGLARQAAVGNSTVSMVEAGRQGDVGIMTLYKIAAVLDVPATSLLPLVQGDQMRVLYDEKAGEGPLVTGVVSAISGTVASPSGTWRRS